jgi:hypothetical protein
MFKKVTTTTTTAMKTTKAMQYGFVRFIFLEYFLLFQVQNVKSTEEDPVYV